MPYSKLYQLDTSDTEWQVAHLFEHLLIRGFYSRLAQKHIQPDLISWVNGENFEGILFVTTLFYTEELADEFEAYSTNLPLFTDAEIAYSLATLEAEDKVLISVNDMPALQQELAKLSRKKWNVPVAPIIERSVPEPEILTEKRSAKNFRDILVLVKSENLTIEEQKLYLRIHILLQDLITDSLALFAGIYHRSDSIIGRHNQHMGFMVRYTVTKDITVRQIQNAIATIASAPITDLAKILACHFATFSTEPLWQDAPIEYFRSTGIITTNQEIAELATTERVTSILDKTSFEVKRMTPGYEQYLQ